jgi:hypothetical protein
MGVYEGRGTLGKAMKDLNIRWAEARTNWQDKQAEDFEKEHLQPLQKDLAQCVTAMDHIATLLSTIRKECSE